MRAEAGDRLVKLADSDDGVFLVKVFDRTEKSVRTGWLKPVRTQIDWRGKLSNYRAYDKVKVDQIMELSGEIDQKRLEIRELFESLEKIE